LGGGAEDAGPADAGPTPPDAGTPAAEEFTVTINEVVTSGGNPNDWVELYNAGPGVATLDGYVLKDSDDNNIFLLPAGTTIPAEGFLVLEEATFGFGLGSADAVRLFGPDGISIIHAYSWTQHAAPGYGACPEGERFLTETTRVTKGTANDCAPGVVLNEIESSDGASPDWVELYNASLRAIDVSGYVLRDDDDAHAYILPNGSVIAAGRTLVLEEPDFGFGLSSADSARLFLPDGTTLLDSYSWAAHAPRTYGRCPTGGPFTSLLTASKGAANACEGEIAAASWPGTSAAATSDLPNAFGANLSGLSYEAGPTPLDDVIWAVRNEPSVLHRLVPSGANWVPDPADSWGAGKDLNYTDGAGSPDAEGVTRAELAESGIYVAAERDNDNGDVSRLSVLRFDTAHPASSLVATHEWNLTGALPTTDANRGLEAIAWMADTWLLSQAFYDDRLMKAYDPSDYPAHGAGLFVVGVEATGMLYLFALSSAGSTYQQVSELHSGNERVNALEFDQGTGKLWSYCGAGCAEVASVLSIDTTPGSPTLGRLTLRSRYLSPTPLGSLASEGIAVAPESRCDNRRHKPFFWSDDAQNGNHSLWRGSVPCGP
jgi:hypothetical protein